METKSTDSSSRQAAKDNMKDLTSRALDFLSNASNETLGACLVGLGAITYLFLGRLGLLLIGIVCGVILHATWDGNSQGGVHGGGAGADLKRRKELGLEVIQRILDWQEKKQNGLMSNGFEDHGLDVALSARRQLDFADFRPATGTALTGLVDAVIRDYVK
jgi:hypothetical protein